MPLEIRPEPDDEERAAIEAALVRLLDEEASADDRGAEWWRAGLRESVEEPEDPF